MKCCRICGCTEDDCSDCVLLSGETCIWVTDDLCSVCNHFVKGGTLELITSYNRIQAVLKERGVLAK